MFVIFTDFQHANLYPFQNLSHGFIVKYRILKIWANSTLSILMKFIKECEGRLIKYGCVFLLSEARFMSLQGGGGGGRGDRGKVAA